MIHRKTVPASLSMVGEDDVLIRMSTGDRARDGHILLPGGCLLENYRANPIQLWQHNPEEPVGTNSDIVIGSDAIEARSTFAPLGVSATADKIRGLVKGGVIRAVSIGFDIIEAEPIDPARPRGGLRVSKWELLECSFVSVPADPGAVVTARAQQQENAGMTDVFAAKRTRMLREQPQRAVRDLYDCAQLAYVLNSLGYLHSGSVWEAECEGDNSPVPAMLGEALQQLGKSLIAMTAEEVHELLEAKDLADPDLDDVEVGERAFILAGRTPAIRAWRRGLAAMRVRAGKTLSAATAAKLDDAHNAVTTASERAANSDGYLKTATEHHESLSDLHARAQTAHGKMAAAIEDASGAPPADVAEKLAKVQQQHRALGKCLDGIGDHAAAIGDGQADAAGEIAGSQRCMRAAMRCLRGVIDGNDAAEKSADGDSEDIQTSAGTADSAGSENDRALSLEARQRRAAALALAAA